ncbi:MAG: hypothetical protein KF893_18530, partial [Caldilineaceae bacterium]|nr:hypothetical protein [Caldilineaceae bacterium]
MKRTDENVILLPDWLMERLELTDGDAIALIVEGTALHFKPLERFLSLRGLYQDDDSFAKAIQDLEPSSAVLNLKKAGQLTGARTRTP